MDDCRRIGGAQAVLAASAVGPAKAARRAVRTDDRRQPDDVKAMPVASAADGLGSPAGRITCGFARDQKPVRVASATGTAIPAR
ncbi:MAG: hypothetical protein IRZ07_23995 [Microbispora sp.]|nr:hypothetical protein [Microbispora sp.]